MKLARGNRAWTMIGLLVLVIMLTACGAKEDNDRSENGGIESTSAASPTASPAAPAETEAPASAEPRVLTDVMGHEVTIPGQIERPIAPYLEDSLAAIGIKPPVQTSYDGQKPAYEYLKPWMEDVPLFDLSGGLNYEQALGQDPDLIVLFHPGFAADGKYEGYSKIAPTYVMDSTSDWRSTLLTMGEIFNRTQEAQQAIEEYDAKAAAARDALRDKLGEFQVAIVSPDSKGNFSLWIEKFWSGNVMYNDLGLLPPAMIKGKEAMENYSLETLSELNEADHIFVINTNGEVETSGIMDNPVWQALPAVQKGAVTEVTSQYWSINGVIANNLIVDDVLAALLDG